MDLMLCILISIFYFILLFWSVDLIIGFRIQFDFQQLLKLDSDAKSKECKRAGEKCERNVKTYISNNIYINKFEMVYAYVVWEKSATEWNTMPSSSYHLKNA